jgi:hypothetical protein
MASLELAIEKACEDACSYALGLVTGEVFAFHVAHERGGMWLHLEGFGPWNEDGVLYYGPGQYTGREEDAVNLRRGVDVRRDQVVWVADYPGGS